jgi:hypothetical protein
MAYATIQEHGTVSTTAPRRRNVMTPATRNAGRPKTQHPLYLVSSLLFFMNLNSIFVYLLNVRSGRFPNTSSFLPSPPHRPHAPPPSTRHMYSCLPCCSLSGEGLFPSPHCEPENEIYWGRGGILLQKNENKSMCVRAYIHI